MSNWKLDLYGPIQIPNPIVHSVRAACIYPDHFLEWGISACGSRLYSYYHQRQPEPYTLLAVADADLLNAALDEITSPTSNDLNYIFVKSCIDSQFDEALEHLASPRNLVNYISRLISERQR